MRGRTCLLDRAGKEETQQLIVSHAQVSAGPRSCSTL